MRKTSLDCVYELAKKDKRVLFIGSDLGPGVLENFKTIYLLSAIRIKAPSFCNVFIIDIYDFTKLLFCNIRYICHYIV